MNKFLSPLRYAGGKSKQAKMISEYFPNDIKKFYEPFVGGGSVFLELKNQGKINGMTFINDHNIEVSNFWINASNEYVNRRYELFYKEVLKEKEELGINFIKEKYFDDKGKLKNEWKDYYLLKNKMTFNGIGSFSKQACESNFRISTIERYAKLWKLMSNVSVQSLDWKDFLAQIEDNYNDIYIYFDPPYISSKKLYKGHDDFEHELLSKEIKNLDKKGVKFVLSYDNDPRILAMYQGFKFIKKEWKYTMTNNSKDNKTKEGKELIITNIK